MPTGWDLYLTLPLGKDILDELKPLDLIELKNHLFSVRRELRETSTCSCEAQSNVEDMMFSIVFRRAAMSEDQSNLWVMEVGFPVYDGNDQLVEFFVDQEGLEKKERERLERKEGRKCEPVMRGGGLPEQHGDNHESYGKAAKEKPVILHSRTLFSTNGLISYKNTFFPPCGGSFKDVNEFEEYFATLTTDEKILLGHDVLRIVDRTPNAWELLTLDGANAEVERRESIPVHHINDDDDDNEEEEEEEEASPCSCMCNDCESCQGSDEEKDNEEEESETEDEDAKKSHRCSACQHHPIPTPDDMRRMLGRTPTPKDSTMQESKRIISDIDEEVVSFERDLRCQLDLVKRWRALCPISKKEQTVVVQQLSPPPQTQIPVQVWTPLSQTVDVHAPPPTPQIIVKSPYTSPHANPSPRGRAPETSCLYVESHRSPRLYIHKAAARFPDMVKVAPAPEPVRSSPPYYKTPMPREVSMWNEKRVPSDTSNKGRQCAASSHYPPHPSVEDVIDSPKVEPSKASMPRTSSGMSKKAIPAGEIRVPHRSEYSGTAEHVSSPPPHIKLPTAPEHIIVQSSSPRPQAQIPKLLPLSTHHHFSSPPSRYRRNVRFENEDPQVYSPGEVRWKANQGVRRSTPANLPAHDSEEDFWEGSWRDV